MRQRWRWRRRRLRVGVLVVADGNDAARGTRVRDTRAAASGKGGKKR